VPDIKTLYEKLLDILHKIYSKKIYIAILIILIPSTSAYAIIYINWNIKLTGNLPDVRFYLWKDHSIHTALSLSYDIYPNVWVRVKNISYGLENAADVPKNISLFIQGISDSDKIDDLKIIIKKPDGSAIATLEWFRGKPMNESKINVLLSPKTIYTIEIWIKGSSQLKVNDEITISLLIIVYD